MTSTVDRHFIVFNQNYCDFKKKKGKNYVVGGKMHSDRTTKSFKQRNRFEVFNDGSDWFFPVYCDAKYIVNV